VTDGRLVVLDGSVLVLWWEPTIPSTKPPWPGWVTCGPWHPAASPLYRLNTGSPIPVP